MEVLDLVKNTVKKIDPKAEIILFGSRARGDHSMDSDWDFLILIDKQVTEALKRQIRDKLFEIELKTDEIISSIIENKEEWTKFEITPLYKNVKKEGQTL